MSLSGKNEFSQDKSESEKKMSHIALKIAEKIKELPDAHLYKVLDFIESLIRNQNREMSDTEYLEAIPGMTESIDEGRKEKIEDCASLKDIGWE